MRAKTHRLTQDEFVERCVLAHGNKYDYRKAVYKNEKTKVVIICPDHGEFTQQAASHFRLKQGCPICGRIKNIQASTKHKYTIETLSKKIKNPNFEIVSTEFKNIHSKITVKCKKHNQLFNTDGTSLIRKKAGMICPQCNDECEQSQTRKSKHVRTFLDLARKIHGNKYDYTKSKYANQQKKVEIICSIHGSFWQSPSIHTHGGCGCPSCSFSQGESRIQVYLNSNNIPHITQYKVNINDSNHYFDFYVPDKNLMIEFNGLQHYKPIKWFGGAKALKICKLRDQLKKTYCKESNIKLLVIHYKDKHMIEEILNKHLK